MNTQSNKAGLSEKDIKLRYITPAIRASWDLSQIRMEFPLAYSLLILPLISTSCFFNGKGPTERTWFYRLDMPEGYKNFSKTKPMLLEHFKHVLDWCKNRHEIEEDGVFRARDLTLEELRLVALIVTSAAFRKNRKKSCHL